MLTHVQFHNLHEEDGTTINNDDWKNFRLRKKS